MRNFFIATIVVALGVLPATTELFGQTYEVTPKETRALMNKDTNIVVLDVRSQMEYNEERIANTPLMPLQFVEKRIADLQIFKKKKIIVYCHSGNRSELAVEILREHGFNAYNMNGGILRWKAERFPTITGK